MILEDNSPMPYGIYQGTPMINIPANYLIYLWNNNMMSAPVKLYIKNNLDVLKEEIKRQKYENQNTNN